MIVKESTTVVAQWLIILILVNIVTIFFQPLLLYLTCPLSAIFLIFLLHSFWDHHRDPDGEGMLSPADGKVLKSRADQVVRIFMNIHNVHINRAPLDGRIINISYRDGKIKLPISKDSDSNEKQIITIGTNYGPIDITQIAGPFFRRIVSYVKVGDIVKRGDRIGVIHFGSRVDVTVPHKFEMLVSHKDKVKAGKTVIATEK